MTIPNTGWAIFTMAITLNIQLEKPGYYMIGDSNGLSPKHITKALNILLLTAALFAVSITVKLLDLKTLILTLIL
jgi:cobalamin biosynthesis protein CobD/CbiB